MTDMALFEVYIVFLLDLSLDILELLSGARYCAKDL